MTDLDGLNVVTEKSERQLQERQLVDYRSHREKCLQWLLSVGKEPDKYDGYAFQTVKSRAHRMDYLAL
jgi:hypothetical protein